MNRLLTIFAIYYCSETMGQRRHKLKGMDRPDLFLDVYSAAFAIDLQLNRIVCMSMFVHTALLKKCQQIASFGLY